MAVREYAAARLPQYMLPAAVVVLEALPLTVNGKVDKAALPAPDYAAGAGSGRGAANLREELLCEIFADILRVEEVGPEDSFFELGGHSLLAMSVVDRLRSFGLQLSLRAFIAAPTVAGIIGQLRRVSESELKALDVLLPIRVRGSKPPFFCLHAAGGRSWCYMPLARYVPADYPLYGLQARGLKDSSQLATSVREMASDYIEQIRSVQESGPYHLLGWSSGGIVAHEIAVQLQAQGEQVAALVVMDTYPPDKDADEEDDEGPDGLVVQLHDNGLGEELRGALSQEEIDLHDQVYQNNAMIGDAHDLGVFNGNLLVISGLSPDGPKDASYAALWQPYISGKISQSHLPCKHEEMARPDMLAQTWDLISTWLRLTD
jgi:thioesterase domain-containing protein/aryl carrier-like protein